MSLGSDDSNIFPDQRAPSHFNMDHTGRQEDGSTWGRLDAMDDRIICAV